MSDGRIPALAEPWATALNEAIVYAQATWDTVAIIATGTIIRGNPQATSDLDIVVVHIEPWRQRVQCRFNGVAAELFVNPEFELLRGFSREAAHGRPAMTHMLATGIIVHDTDGVGTRLRLAANQALVAGPSVPLETITAIAYAAACNFEDAGDIKDVDPDRARMLIASSLAELANLRFLRARMWMPRGKTLLSDLATLDPELASIIRGAVNATDVATGLALAAPAVERIIGAPGFFEWTGEPQPLEP